MRLRTVILSIILTLVVLAGGFIAVIRFEQHRCESTRLPQVHLFGCVADDRDMPH